MRIGKPRRVYTIEPIEDPVPKAPEKEPAPDTSDRPAAPRDAGRATS